MRFIDAYALKKAITEGCRSETECLNHLWYDENLVALIDNAPTVERPKGEWIGKGISVMCSECSALYSISIPEKFHSYNIKMNYCPNCGADMRDGED